MNLATRCTSCGTLFRVVQDQLKVSDGWVRCGHCHAVFSALESLFDLDSDQLPPGPPVGPATSRPAAYEPSPAAPSDISFAGRPVVDPATPDADRMPSGGVVPRDPGLVRPSLNAERRTEIEGEPPWAAAASDASLAGPSSAPGGSPQADRIESTPALPHERVADLPDAGRRSFMAPRRRPGLWATLALGLVVLLGAQALLHARDPVAARWPALQPVLAASCSMLACRVELPRAIDEVAVENTGLVKTALPGAFMLSVGLRNRGTYALAVPSVELSLTDIRGQLVARRVLAPKDFEKAPEAIRPGADAVLQALLATPDSLVSGYTVEIFYP